MALTTFPEDDLCPKLCTDMGAFKKSEINPYKVLEEQKKAKEAIRNAKPIKEGPSKGVADETSEETSLRPPPSGEVHLPNLKPGPDGKVDWTPLGNMTGTRPIVNKYSISRYSLNEWRKHNEHVLNTDILNESNVLDYNAKTSMMQAFGNIDKQQMDNNRRLKQKAKDIFKWKAEVEKACKAITEEVELLEIERQRLKGASRVLMLPESITNECLELRSNRFSPDLVSDLAEQELLKESKLVKEVRAVFKSTLDSIEEQMAMNKAAKHKIEYDWCDKTMAYNTESQNLGLSPKSNTLMFRPGATKYGDYTAPMEYWEFFCRETIQNCEGCRQKSVDLRGSLNAILVTNGRKLRTQADKTDIALAETVAIQSELCTKLEEMLRTTLRKLADTEYLIENLQHSVKRMDVAMKLAQTRLDNRNNGRPHGESVKDPAHIGLIDEVRKIHETVTSLLGQLRKAESVRHALLDKRLELEREIASKRKSLNIDRERCGMVRSHYPSASELAGY